MKKMIKRADGSSSPQGFWDNVRKKASENKRKGVKGKKVTEALKDSAKASMKNGGTISCWKGYEKKGTKIKGGKTVNNCVKKK